MSRQNKTHYYYLLVHNGRYFAAAAFDDRDYNDNINK